MKHDFGDGHPVKAHKHKNGGGWVADSATVYKSAYVGPNARVFEDAMVLHNARVEGYAMVHGDAVVQDNAVIGGVAQVCGEALVKDNVEVWGTTVVTMEARLSEANKAAKHDKVVRQIRNVLASRYRMMAAEFKKLLDDVSVPLKDMDMHSYPRIEAGKVGIRHSIEAIIRVAKYDDPKFDAAGFRVACGLED
jgi:serine acetyltransferase